MPTEVLTTDDLEPIRQLLQQSAQRSAENTEGIAELKVLTQQNSQAISRLERSQAENAEQITKNVEGIAELIESIAELKESVSGLRDAMQRSYEDMVSMLTQFAEEAAADRTVIRTEMAEFARQAAADREVIREAIAALFWHQGNGGGQSE